MGKEINEVVNRYKSVSIFGAGSSGFTAYEYLTNSSIKVDNFYDNDQSKHNTIFCECEVLNPELILQKKPLIVIASTWENQIVEQLKNMNYENYTFIDILGFEEEYKIWKKNRVASDLNLEFFQKNSKNLSKWTLPKLIKNSNEIWAKELVKIYERDISFPASLSPAAGELYRSLLLNIAPKTIVEIGIFMGVSTIWAASALKDLEIDAKIYSIDLFNNKRIDENHFEYVKNIIKSAEISDIVELFQLNSYIDFEKFLPNLSNKKIDFLFIDGDHTPRGATLDFLKFNDYLAIGGYIMLHDIFPEYCGWEGPAFIIDQYIKHNSENFELCQIYTTPNNYGLALIRKIK
ncbi:O-methyltransferase [Aliarcobacter butzleri]